MTSTKHIAVVGGGAAGMLAAGTALAMGARVTVFEHRDRTLLKLGITGKGRCNLTNNAPPSELIAAVVHNPRFLYTAFSAFSSATSSCTPTASFLSLSASTTVAAVTAVSTLTTSSS